MRLDRDAVHRVIGLLKQSKAEELAIQDGDTYVRARRQVARAAAPAAEGPRTEETTVVGFEGVTQTTIESSGAGLHVVRAAMVGLFHRGREFDSEPLVEVGDRVSEGQVIGTIEALRKLTDVVCDADGELVEVLHEDGEPVEYAQALFSIRLEEGGG